MARTADITVAKVVVLDAVFSLDSIITALGMVDNVLLMIGVVLVVDGFGLHIPKGYLYAAIAFSILIEILNQLAARGGARALTRRRIAETVLRLLGGVPLQAERKMVEEVLGMAERSVTAIMTPRARHRAQGGRSGAVRRWRTGRPAPRHARGLAGGDRRRSAGRTRPHAPGGKMTADHLPRERSMESTERNMMDHLKAVIADAEELLRATADQAGPKVREVRERAEESLRTAREHLRGAGAELDNKVRANPWAAVGIAAGVGLILGILLSRK